MKSAVVAAGIIFLVAWSITTECLGQQSLLVTERNSSKVFLELLRGRDGLPGRDGLQGPAGPQGERGPSGKEGPPGPRSGGVTYIRWGNRSCGCTTEGTELVYSGITGGTKDIEEGGGANYLCMPTDPEYSTDLIYASGVRGHAHIYGIEYWKPLQGGQQHDVACAVCHVKTRSTVLMIPAKASCPATWTREYYGYIMTEYKGIHNSAIRGRTMFECVDKGMETVTGVQIISGAASFHHVEADCNHGLSCAPGKYNNHQELNCVVCTK